MLYPRTPLDVYIGPVTVIMLCGLTAKNRTVSDCVRSTRRSLVTVACGKAQTNSRSLVQWLYYAKDATSNTSSRIPFLLFYVFSNIRKQSLNTGHLGSSYLWASRTCIHASCLRLPTNIWVELNACIEPLQNSHSFLHALSLLSSILKRPVITVQRIVIQGKTPKYY